MCSLLLERHDSHAQLRKLFRMVQNLSSTLCIAIVWLIFGTPAQMNKSSFAAPTSHKSHCSSIGMHTHKFDAYLLFVKNSLNLLGLPMYLQPITVPKLTALRGIEHNDFLGLVEIPPLPRHLASDDDNDSLKGNKGKSKSKIKGKSKTQDVSKLKKFCATAITRDAYGIPDKPLNISRPNLYLRNSNIRWMRTDMRDSGKGNPTLLHISGGQLKSLKLESPSVFIRPMMSKVKEATFSLLESIGIFQQDQNHSVLDLYSGSGSVGIEALSRGATNVTFVDIERECCLSINRNLQRCNMLEKANVVRAAAEEALSNPSRFAIYEKFDVVFVCPPYEEVQYSHLISMLANNPVSKEDSVIVIEYPYEIGSLPHDIANGSLIGFRNRRYGRTVIGVYISKPTKKFKHLKFREDEFKSFVKSRRKRH